MRQRLSLVTLGVADIERSRRFYEALGWVGESPDGEVPEQAARRSAIPASVCEMDH